MPSFQNCQTELWPQNWAQTTPKTTISHTSGSFPQSHDHIWTYFRSILLNNIIIVEPILVFVWLRILLTVLESGHYYLQFSINIFLLKSQFWGFWAPNWNPNISVNNKDKGLKQQPTWRSWKVLSEYEKKPFDSAPKKVIPLNSK